MRTSVVTALHLQNDEHPAGDNQQILGTLLSPAAVATCHLCVECAYCTCWGARTGSSAGAFSFMLQHLRPATTLVLHVHVHIVVYMHVQLYVVHDMYMYMYCAQPPWSLV